MTLFSAERPLLIAIPSRARALPTFAPVRARRSEPARSTNVSFDATVVVAAAVTSASLLVPLLLSVTSPSPLPLER